MDYPMFEHRGVECWELEWHPGTGEIVARGLTYEIDAPDVEVRVPAPDLSERFAEAVDAWCAEHGIEHPLTLDDAMRREAPCSVWVGDAEGGGHD